MSRSWTLGNCVRMWRPPGATLRRRRPSKNTWNWRIAHDHWRAHYYPVEESEGRSGIHSHTETAIGFDGRWVRDPWIATLGSGDPWFGKERRARILSDVRRRRRHRGGVLGRRSCLLARPAARLGDADDGDLGGRWEARHPSAQTPKTEA